MLYQDFVRSINVRIITLISKMRIAYLWYLIYEIIGMKIFHRKATWEWKSDPLCTPVK